MGWGKEEGTMISRRDFLKYSALTGAALSVPLGLGVGSAEAFYNSAGIPLFKTALRGVGPAGIPVADADLFPAPVTGVTHYTIDVNEFTDQIVPTGLLNGV